MAILTSPFHSYQTDDLFVGAHVEGDTLIIANTRNEESASEGNYMNLVTVIPLIEAIAIAKMILTSQQQAEDDAWVDEQWQRYQDRQAMEDDHLEHELDVQWLRSGC